MLSSTFRRAATTAASRSNATINNAKRTMAIGPAKGGEISDELLAKLGSLSTQALVDGLWVMGWPSAQIDGARPLHPSHKCVGRAVTLNFVPARPDIAQDKPAGENSPEYEAFEKCGPNEVLVMSSVGPWESVGGDIKFLRLKQLSIGGLVTDGSVRDTDEIINYGFPCFSYSTTARQGPGELSIVDESISCALSSFCSTFFHCHYTCFLCSCHAAMGVQWCH
jgi:regulator of RNase E activity RraA